MTLSVYIVMDREILPQPLNFFDLDSIPVPLARESENFPSEGFFVSVRTEEFGPQTVRPPGARTRTEPLSSAQTFVTLIKPNVCHIWNVSFARR